MRAIPKNKYCWRVIVLNTKTHEVDYDRNFWRDQLDAERSFSSIESLNRGHKELLTFILHGEDPGDVITQIQELKKKYNIN